MVIFNCLAILYIQNRKNVQMERKQRSNVIKDEDGSQRKDKKYSSK